MKKSNSTFKNFFLMLKPEYFRLMNVMRTLNNDHYVEIKSVLKVIVLGVIFIACASVSAQDSESNRTLPFDHQGVGFDIDGAHAVVACEGCHLGQRFVGTPRECGICHSLNGLVKATPKSSNHITTSEFCESCHRTTVWNDITRVDHSQTIGACETCHNGITAGGKSPNHVFTTDSCDVCHSDLSWTPALFDHGNISSGCSDCHNGQTATGKNLDHIQSSEVCESCHSTIAWQPASVDHNAVFGSCSSCHNGGIATGKNITHVPTTAECDSCHSTIAWLPATFDHSTTTETCSSCHNGAITTGKSANHFGTIQECDRCHSTSSWLADVFSHASPNYPGDHSAPLACTDCHTSNSQIITWAVAAYQPNCAACHAQDYREGPHTKLLSPQVSYNVSELRDCAGACHIYTDGTFTTILQLRSGNHRASDSEF